MKRLFPNSIRRHMTCGALAAAGLGLGLRAQAPAAAPSGWQITGEVAQGFDSNILLGLDHAQADSTTELQLGLGKSWSGPRWSFSAGYTPEAVTYARHAKLSFVSHGYHQMWTYALGPHTQLSWGAAAERFPERGGAPTGGLTPLAATANASQAMALNAVLTDASTNLGLTHQYSLRSSWTLGFNGALQAYSADHSLAEAGGGGNLPSSALLGHTHTLGGTLAWSHQVAESTHLQASAGQSSMWYGGNLGQRVQYYNLQATVLQTVGSVLSLQAGAGPAWSRTYSGAGTASFNLPATSYAANASIEAHTGRSQYGLSWQHSDQVGLNLGGLTTDLLALNYGLQWGQIWSASVSVGQSRGTTATMVAAATTSVNQDSAFASSQILCRIARHWSLQASGNYFTQAMPNGLGGTRPFRRVQASVGVSFTSGGAQ